MVACARAGELVVARRRTARSGATAHNILLEAGLSYLGLGVEASVPSWGGMILDAKDVLITAPWASVFPGLAIVVTVLAVNLCGDAVRDALDPRRA